MKYLLLFLFCSNALAQEATSLEPILFSSKTEKKIQEMNAGAIIIDQDQIDQVVSPRIVDVLKKVPGLDIVQTGINGGQSTLFLRGMEGRHTLILIDGIRAYDPASISRTFNLALLNTVDIERIEVIKGAQSVLYGSDAIAGVVNIITKKGSAKNTIFLGTGYYDQLGVNHSSETEYGLFNINAFVQESLIDSEATGGAEKDLSNAKGFTLNHYAEKNRLEFNTSVKYNSNFNYTDAAPVAEPVDDENSFGRDAYTQIRESITYHHNDKVDVNLDLSHAVYDRENKFLSSLPDNYGTSEFDGSITFGEFRIKEKLDDGQLLYGFVNTTERYETKDTSEKTLTMLDAYLTRTKRFDHSSFEYGARMADNSDFGAHIVYSLGYNYFLGQHHTFKLAHMTGFKAPSNFQQNDPENGNEDLAPEKSSGFDVDYVYQKDSIRWSMSAFYNQVDNFVQFVTSKGYQNVNNARYIGWESGFEVEEAVGTVGAHIQLNRYDLSDGSEAVRRPNAMLKLNYLFNFSDANKLNIFWRYRSRSFDKVGSDVVELNPYDVWDIDYTHLTESFKIVAAVKNVFNREYEDVFGYATLGTAFQLNVDLFY